MGAALTFDDPAAAEGDTWSIRSRMSGLTVHTNCTGQGNPPPAGCAATINGNQITLSWAPFNEENDNYVVRVNGAFEALVPFDGDRP